MYWERSGDRSIGGANLRKGRQPFNGRHASCLAGAPCALFIQNHCVKSGKLGFGGNELRKCIRTSLMGSSFCIGNGVGIEALAEPIFVRGVSPFYGWRTLRPPCACLVPALCLIIARLGIRSLLPKWNLRRDSLRISLILRQCPELSMRRIHRQLLREPRFSGNRRRR